MPLSMSPYVLWWWIVTLIVTCVALMNDVEEILKFKTFKSFKKQVACETANITRVG
jgi:hypothetical protein